MKELIKRQVTDRVVMKGAFIPLRHERGRLNGAPYTVVNTSSAVTTEGKLHIPPSGLTLRINAFDNNGADNSAYISSLRAGDKINIGSTPVTLVNSPIHNSGTYSLFVEALPSVVNGDYLITVTKLAPSLILDFSSGPLDPRVVFSRASTATYIGSDGLIKTAAINEPRFEANGLLFEESRTNSQTYSEQFDKSSVWSLFNATVSQNASIAPDGNATADKLIESTGNSGHNTYTSLSATSGIAYCHSAFIKSAGRHNFVLRFEASGGVFAQQFIIVNLETEATYGGNSPLDYGMEKLGNGWFRVWVSAIASATAGGYVSQVLADSEGEVSYQGDGVSGVYIWGAQVEIGSTPTSYIPTVATAATRAADSAYILDGFATWGNAVEGSILVNIEMKEIPETGTAVLGLVGSDGANNTALIKFGESISGADAESSTGGVSQVNTSSFSLSNRDKKRFYFGYKTNDFVFGVNQATPFTDNACVFPTAIAFIAIQLSDGYLTAWISSIVYYKTRIPNSAFLDLTKP